MKVDWVSAFWKQCLHPLVFLISIIFFLALPGKTQPAELKFRNDFQNARSDSDKVVALSILAEHYYAQKEDKKGDSIVNMQILVAEESRNPNLILFSLFKNARFQYVTAFAKNETDKSAEFINRALQYAKFNGLDDYTALAYSKLGDLYSNQGKQDIALKNATIGFTTALHTTNDSVKAISAFDLGNVYLQQANILMAFKTYTNGYDYANNLHNAELKSLAYHHFSKLFKTLKKDETAKDYIFKSLALNREEENPEGLMRDYLAFGQLYDYKNAVIYLQRAEKLADSINSLRCKLKVQELIFLNKMIYDEPTASLSYLNNHPQLQKFLRNTGPGYMEWQIAEVYLYRDLPDSAIRYFKSVEQNFETGYDLKVKTSFFGEMADCYNKLGNTTEAIRYYQKSMALASQASDLRIMQYSAAELKNSFEEQQDFKQAFYYDKLYDNFTDSMNLLTRENELALLEIDNENKRRLREEELAIQQERRRHDLQYMGITIVVAIAMVLLITLGMFTVSRTTIRVMGFLAFILLFEFIILVLDSYIHHLTHGEPLKIYAIKIVLISMLFPLHHFLEEKVIHYLLSRKLITIRSRFSLKRLIFGENHKHTASKKPVEPEINVNEIIAD